ncbi:MAG: hypothetical protein JWN68_871 [Nocardioides sp.]|jgi:hypothetical protein|nr:hypothetical protein [Nocardioides sp.]
MYVHPEPPAGTFTVVGNSVAPICPLTTMLVSVTVVA